MIEEKPNIKLIDEDTTVTISLYKYNCLLQDSFKLETAKVLYDVTKAKLDNLYNYLMTEKNDLYLSSEDTQTIRAIYYDIKDDIRDN